jgi:hypothetical protein
MAVLEPLLVVISNFDTVSSDSSLKLQIPDFPFDVARGSHELIMGPRVYIDKSDFRTDNSDEVLIH